MEPQLEERHKGGRKARQAAMLCQSEEFRLWLDRRARAKYNLVMDDGTHTEQDARDFILQACAVESRAELDHNDQASAMFAKILQAYSRYRYRQKQATGG
ncbi:hypothetical protein [Marinobacterium stanieri]|uniref:Uncharacterized protein n=1 Tax=Marinobacterium stanieri TaxID=49186 RepID=A0A1N6Q4F4_9GAMM|nr:hypothetical protein [Marinobacterium stanieri]SIQ11471.1 hypothetical protein SAMN05421647_102250 [Marinobacterium stanieri]